MPTITDESFRAAADAVTKVLNDEIILTELGKLGYKLGERVRNVSVQSGATGLLNDTGVVIGYQTFGSISYVLVNWATETVGCERPPSSVHSSYHNVIPSKKIWAMNPQKIQKEDAVMSDVQINLELAKCGLYAGQTVTLGRDYEGIRGIVAGISKGTVVLSISPSDQNKVFTSPIEPGELHSAFSTTTKYSKFSTAFINEAKKASAPPARNPIDVKDDKITLALAKDGLRINQSVHWKNSVFSNREMLVVGHDGHDPILVFNDPSGAKQEPTIIYKTNKQDCLHSKFSVTAFPVFALHKKDLETTAERTTRMLAETVKIKAKAADDKIVEGLRQIGFKLGDEVEYLINPYGEPRMEAITPSSVGTKSKGYVAGLLAGHPVIRPSQTFPDAWKEDERSECVHSSYAGKGNKFWAVHKGYLKKVQSQGERQATAHARLSEIQAKFASNHFPKFSVKGLAAKKKNPIRADLKKAGYRIAAKQSLKLTHGMVCNLLRNKGASNEKVQAMATLLSSEYGKATMAVVLGLVLQQAALPNAGHEVPSNNENRLRELAQELRIAGMTIAGNELIETIFTSALEVMLSQETEKKVRVSSDDNLLLEESLLEETYSTEDKKRSA